MLAISQEQERGMENELSTMETIPDKFPGECEERTGDADPETSLVTKSLCALAKGQEMGNGWHWRKDVPH
jgi:hypothetical protein